MLYSIQANKQKLPDSCKDGLILHKNVLQYREHATYLGIILDDKLSWKEQITELNKKSSNILESFQNFDIFYH